MDVILGWALVPGPSSQGESLGYTAPKELHPDLDLLTPLFVPRKNLGFVPAPDCIDGCDFRWALVPGPSSQGKSLGYTARKELHP